MGSQPVETLRDTMVRTQIAQRGVRDPRVLDALRRVPRERFVPPEQAAHAYDDRALPIGLGQTISQPYMVAVMTAALRVGDHHTVLEIGTGSGLPGRRAGAPGEARDFRRAPRGTRRGRARAARGTRAGARARGRCRRHRTGISRTRRTTASWSRLAHRGFPAPSRRNSPRAAGW